MEKFLKQTAEYLLKKFDNNLSEINVIFPNRRAGLFFQKYLSELIEKPIFSPRIFTISELIESSSGLKAAPPETLVVELWQVFSSITKSDETLDDFYFWGEMLLTDFNDIDKYLVDAKKLFKNIVSLKEIDAGFDFLTEEQRHYLSTFWKAILDLKNSESKQKFLSIWKNLSEIYHAYNNVLKAKNRAYEGMIYREMAQKIISGDFSLQGENWVVVGFNALNTCEKKIFRFLQANCSALFFWDYDEYYLDAPQHEAALFIRPNLVDFPMPDDFSMPTANFKTLKEATLVAVPGFSGQALYVSRWLDTNREIVNTRFDNTAVVMCNESLLMPVLTAIPETIEKLNITMGFPLKNSALFSLIKNLIDIDRNSRPDEQGNPVFYHRNVLTVVNHPLLAGILNEERDNLNREIKQNNLVYLSANHFKEVPLLHHIFSIPENTQAVKPYLQEIIIKLFELMPDTDTLTRETLYQLSLALNRIFQSLFENTDIAPGNISKKLFYKLMLRQLERITVPFEGEPLTGTQLMGFLETRCLDFDNLIFLSFNDDRLPGNSHRHSFIPFSLRKGFGMPGPEQHNAIYSYYFYRLIQRAKNLTMIYDTRSEGLSKGEPSRFATQLKYEAKHLTINEQQAVFNFEPVETEPIVIEKTAPVTNKLISYLTGKGLTPSSINNYIDCKLKFYFKYIEGIDESDDIAEEIDQMMFGRIAHKALESLYKPLIGKDIEKQNIEQLLKDKPRIERCLNEAVGSEYFKGRDFQLNGKNLLVYEIIRKFVLKVLNYDLEIAPFRLISLENDFEDFEVITLGEKMVNVRLHGYVDRLDKMGDSVRVIDYKTGKDKNEVGLIEDLFADSSKRNKAAFQTLMYARCVQKNMPEENAFMPAVYGANSIFKTDFNPVFSFKDGSTLMYENVAGEYNEHLRKLILDMLDPTIAFTQTENDKMCKFCPFNGMCNRDVDPGF
ncbi:MAG: PD-(D/E)XK nuclease family protein [Prolixibacteraceae bacterium]|nr:PD-(D/E)XK nuclease family protein [Prolixibacteraceae bacterium]